MDLFKAISERRSIRHYKLLPVEIEKVLMAIDIATNAPSAGNLQPWRFIIIDDGRIQEELYRFSYEQPWILNAPLIVAVIADIERCKAQYGDRGYEYAIESVSAAIQNFLLAIQEFGLGGVWVSGFYQGEIDRILNVPKGKMTIALIPIGYPNEKPEPKTVFSLRSRVYFNSYGRYIKDIDKFFTDYADYFEKKTSNIKKALRRLFKKDKTDLEKKYSELISIAEGREGKQKVVKLRIKREKGWLYFIDSDGDISRVPAKWNKAKKSKEEVPLKDIDIDVEENEELHNNS